MPTGSNRPFRARLHRWKNGRSTAWLSGYRRPTVRRSHPKGKLKRGEEPLAGALREVEEETGFRCVPGARLPSALYYVDGRRKRVSYWAAEATDGHFTPNREVDHISWLPPDAARARLTQPRDRDLLDALLSALHLA